MLRPPFNVINENTNQADIDAALRETMAQFAVVAFIGETAAYTTE